MIGQKVLVRTYSAGVHFGTLISHEGTRVELSNAVRIWRWRGANTLNELSIHGCDQEWSRISEAVESIVLTEAIEVIPCKSKAAENLRVSRWG